MPGVDICRDHDEVLVEAFVPFNCQRYLYGERPPFTTAVSTREPPTGTEFDDADNDTVRVAACGVGRSVRLAEAFRPRLSVMVTEKRYDPDPRGRNGSTGSIPGTEVPFRDQAYERGAEPPVTLAVKLRRTPMWAGWGAKVSATEGAATPRTSREVVCATEAPVASVTVTVGEKFPAVVGRQLHEGASTEAHPPGSPEYR